MLMDELRGILSSRPKQNHAVNGNDAWEQLTRKLNELKEDSKFAEVSCRDSGSAALSVDLVRQCLKTFHDASHYSKPPFAVLQRDSLLACEVAIDNLKMVTSNQFQWKRDFAKGLVNNKVPIPLQLIWKLHKAEILQISSYVFRKSGEDSGKFVSDAVLWLLSNSKESSDHAEVVIDTFVSLLIASQSGPLNFQLATICASILKTCAEAIVNLVSNSSDNSVDLFYLTHPQLWSCGGEAMEQFVLVHLLHLLGEQCTSNSNNKTTLQNNVSIQEKCTLNSATPSFRDLLIMIVNGLGAEKVIIQLGVAVVRPTVNWKNIYILIAVLLSEKPDCCDDMRKLTDELIHVGLEGGRQAELAAGFLIARQCCSCNAKSFGTYAVWFSSHFGINSATARNTVQFQSLLQLLTEIVPVESADNLRVHINKVPQAPTSCHSILHDYTALARTRLADLNESSELPGLFSDSNRDAVSGLDSKQGDLVRVLQHFQNTGEIMKPVLEASVLRRQYYRNVFLVELLSLPGSTEKKFSPGDYNLNCETLHEFVLSLKRLGKIPEKLFQAYEGKGYPQEKIKHNEEKETIKRTEGEVEQPRKKKCLDLKSRK